MLLHHVSEVGAKLVGAGEFVEAGIQAAAVDGVAAQRHRIHAVKRGRLVQAHERIGVKPVPSGRMAAVDEGDAGLAMREQRIGDCHAGGAGPNDEVVRFDQV
jgi:hypothetical protein